MNRYQFDAIDPESEAMMQDAPYDEIATKEAYALKSVDDIGHIREMTAALDQNSARLAKGLDLLEKLVQPILNPRNVTPEDDSLPVPVRSAHADELARINEKVYILARRVEAMAESVDF